MQKERQISLYSFTKEKQKSYFDWTSKSPLTNRHTDFSISKNNYYLLKTTHVMIIIYLNPNKRKYSIVCARNSIDPNPNTRSMSYYNFPSTSYYRQNTVCGVKLVYQHSNRNSNTQSRLSWAHNHKFEMDNLECYYSFFYYYYSLTNMGLNKNNICHPLGFICLRFSSFC